MKLIHPGLTLCLLAAASGLSACAGDERTPSRDPHPSSSTLQMVAVAAQPGEPAHGWQYFSDVHGGRAVVISPNGDYYYSHGEGLERVFKANRGA